MGKGESPGLGSPLSCSVNHILGSEVGLPVTVDCFFKHILVPVLIQGSEDFGQESSGRETVKGWKMTQAGFEIGAPWAMLPFIVCCASTMHHSTSLLKGIEKETDKVGLVYLTRLRSVMGKMY